MSVTSSCGCFSDTSCKALNPSPTVPTTSNSPVFSIVCCNIARNSSFASAKMTVVLFSMPDLPSSWNSPPAVRGSYDENLTTSFCLVIKLPYSDSIFKQKTVESVKNSSTMFDFLAILYRILTGNTRYRRKPRAAESALRREKCCAGGLRRREACATITAMKRDKRSGLP